MTLLRRYQLDYNAPCSGRCSLDYLWRDNRSLKLRLYAASICSTLTHGSETWMVTQGSILGPKLFILYVNDICNVSSMLRFVLFADDTTIFLSGDDVKEISKTLSKQLDKLNSWFAVNKLSLNVSKNNYMILAGYPSSLGTPPSPPPSHSSLPSALPPSDYPASARIFGVSSLKITPFPRYI